MSAGTQDFGIIGLGVMGRSLALNIERNGFNVAVYNRTDDLLSLFMTGPAVGKHVTGTMNPQEFVSLLKRPRRILIMVTAGAPVDWVIDEFVPLLEPGDVLIDGGNSYFVDTERRCKSLAAKEILYVGLGVSGGEEGALYGPSLMPGGNETGYRAVEDILVKIAAKAPTDNAPCIAYMGLGGAGHYVKMVHNGIEYGDMQLIAESYDILKRVLNLSNQELADIFSEWNRGELNSFLIDITAQIFQRHDDTGKPGEIIDYILDVATQKGTGKWTTQNALEIGAPTHTMTAAVEARIISSYKQERQAAAKILPGTAIPQFTGDRLQFIEAVRRALYCSKICSYGQGFALMKRAGQEYAYNIPLAKTAAIWRAGCIIRAAFLEDITAAYNETPDLANLLLAPKFQNVIANYQNEWRAVVMETIKYGIPAPAFSASLAYYDSYRSAHLPANLIQAQRDYFGAHTYQRIDQSGMFHTDWSIDQVAGKGEAQV